MLAIEDKIAKARTLTWWEIATLEITLHGNWVTCRQIVGEIGRVTPGNGPTLDAALDDLIAQLEHKQANGIRASGGVRLPTAPRAPEEVR